ncbi:hypothetical protein [Streptomyces tauricus]|uniref:hypothetical protein n=1 Tax=Streptomyces tauricus TaxID=68274 RepID=UPI003F4CBBD3
MLRHSGGRPLDSLYSPNPDRRGPHEVRKARKARLAMPAGIVVLTVTLPLAAASAGPVGREAPASSSASSLSSARASAHSPAGAGRDAGERDAGARGADGDRAAGRRDADSRDAAGSGSGGGPGSAVSVSGSGSGSPGSGEAAVSGHADGGAAERHPSASERSLTLGVGLATAARCGPELTSPDGIEAQTCVLTQGRETWARTYYRNVTGDALTAVLTLLAPGGRTVRMYCAVGADDEPGVCETPRERTVGDASVYSAIAEFAGSAEGADGPLLLRSGSNSPVQNAR